MTPLTNDLARHLIAAWKTISIALTGAFGILGLLTTFRDDLTKKITWAGKATLAGILASSVMGVIAQLVDAETQARSDSKAIARTEAIVANTGVAVKRINRLLVPTTDLTLEVVYNIRCGQPQSPKICDQLGARSSRYFETWPSGSPGFGVLNVAISGRSANLARYRVTNAEASYYAMPSATKLNLRRKGKAADGMVEVRIDAKLAINDGGKLASFLDYSHKSLFLSARADPFGGQAPYYAMLQNRTGQQLIVWSKDLHSEPQPEAGLYWTHRFDDVSGEVLG